MTGERTAKMTAERKAELAESFAATLAKPEATEAEAARLGIALGSYKSLRGRWEARGRAWDGEGQPIRPALARALARDDVQDTGNGKAAAPRAPKPPAGAALVPMIVTVGEMLTAGLTALIGRAVMKLPHEVVVQVTRPDEDGRRQLQEAAVPLAAYLDKRLGGAGEHAPLLVFAAVIGGGVWTRTMMLSTLKSEATRQSASESAAPVSPPSTSSAPAESSAATSSSP